MRNVLDTIIEHKRLEVANEAKLRPLASFIETVTPSTRDFYAALTQPGPRFILECKKASPSKGLIRANFDLTEIAAVYGHYADCISVLTDERFFQGSYDYLATMRQLVDKPLLHKDFIIDSYQIYRGRACGADAVLLMLSVLDDAHYQRLAEVAHSLAMTVLTEVSNEDETRRAVALGARLIGINNRDLRTLSTDLTTSERLAALIPAGTAVVSESGIYDNQQVRQLSKVATAFLVGSSLMAQTDLASAVHALTRGEHKVCGITSTDQALLVASAGAFYAGLIFYPPSARSIRLAEAKTLVVDCRQQLRTAQPARAALRFVGVFVNANISEVVEHASQLQLSAVQLHGDEDELYIAELKVQLSAAGLTSCQVWRAYRVADEWPTLSQQADRILLDSYSPHALGGTGHRFDWQLIRPQQKAKAIMLAGGIGIDTVPQALQLPVLALDMNSALESAPGQKDPQKVLTAFRLIQEFSYE